MILSHVEDVAWMRGWMLGFTSQLCSLLGCRVPRSKLSTFRSVSFLKCEKEKVIVPSIQYHCGALCMKCWPCSFKKAEFLWMITIAMSRTASWEQLLLVLVKWLVYPLSRVEFTKPIWEMAFWLLPEDLGYGPTHTLHLHPPTAPCPPPTFQL